MEDLKNMPKVFKVAISGPLGQRSKTQIVSRALSTICHLRAEGHTFPQIAGIINSLSSRGKTTFSADELRGLFYRVQKRPPQLSVAIRNSQKAPTFMGSSPQNTAQHSALDLKHRKTFDERSTIELALEKLRRTQRLKEI